ncbi:type II toxin-antitoxin system HicA family toxin [Patescibacteria group bacterium]|nr:type II toxin-antitoxin system HicA family toxin [Patescibacteria group bacterium]MBU4017263.1 type II toxin-antitoxin system HicA family toxin [Patescibacteria group bacterium]MBU4099460.1 type II toxin-antitoxin system HicA family toxin [Patescibacteria group bacterium]
MSKLPQVSGKETVKALGKIGFEVIKQKGSHVKLTRRINNQKQIVTVPMHRTIKAGTLRNGILKPINLSVNDFVKLLR